MATPSAASSTPVAAAFVLHSPVLVNRAPQVRNLQEMLGRTCASVSVVQQHEPQEIVGAVQQLVDLDPSRVEDPAFRPLVRNLQVRQLSSAMKHQAALQAIAAAAGSSTAFRLVVEDDCLFGEKAEETLRAVCASAPPEVDVVFLGLPSPKPPGGEGATLDSLWSVFNLLPACDSYLVRPAAAAKLAAAFLPIRFAANIHLTHLLKSNGIDARISVPNAFVDGTKLGVFACTVDANSKLLWNQQYCQMEMLLQASNGGAPYTPEAQAQFEQLLDAQPFKQHPDVLALVAQHLERSGRFDDAQATYERALNAYDSSGCIVNNTSEIMRNYIGLFRHLQKDLPPAVAAR